MDLRLGLPRVSNTTRSINKFMNRAYLRPRSNPKVPYHRSPPDRLPFPILLLPKDVPSWNINNQPSPLLIQSHFRYVSTTWCPTFLPKPVHRAQIFITPISLPLSPVSRNPSVRTVERISKSLSLSLPLLPILTAAAGRTTGEPE